MSRYLRFLIPGLLFTVLVGFFLVGLQRDPSLIPSPLIGKPAPEFSLEDLRDPVLRVATADLAGRTYLLNVWGTWCPGCREEHDTLLTIARSSGVPMIGLNWKDDRTQALRWLSQLGDPYEAVAFDPEGEAAIDWGVYGAPETFLVGADGIILAKRVGPMTLQAWQRDFVPLINGAAGERS
jgi:cytochrome c biogenesis protein CcmG, thiol:disulfide interchange protein DsbE